MLFENRYTMDTRTLTEYQWTFMKRKPLLWVILLAVLAVVVCGVGNLVKNPGLDSAWLMLIILLVLGSLIHGYRKGIRKGEAKRREANGGTDPQIVIAIGEEITVTNTVTNSVQVFHFEQIARLLESRNLCLLMLPQGSGIILRKDSFTQGDAREFRSFIAQKCPQVKG